MYNLLKCDKWKNFVSMDEARLNLTNADERRDVQYIAREKPKTMPVFSQNSLIPKA